MEKKSIRLLVTGGHHTPAMATLEALMKEGGGQFAWEIFWVGHRYSMWADQHDSAEYREVTQKGWPFYDLKAGKFHASWHPLKIWRLPWGFYQAAGLVDEIRPDLILSFGGYLAVPVALAGFFKKVPIITHEQTLSPGLANRALARLAQKVLISWPGTESCFPHSRAILTGLPLRSEVWAVGQPEVAVKQVNPKLQKAVGFAKANHLPLIYITGGKQGSHVINQAVSGCLDKLLPHMVIFHQTGSSSVTGDYQEALHQQARLPRPLRQRYYVQDYYFSWDHYYLLYQANLVISRSGANSVAELGSLGTPSLLIPIPWSSQHEQERNAKELQRSGLSEVLEERELTPESLAGRVIGMLTNEDHYRMAGSNFSGREVHREAALKAAREVLETLTSLAPS